MFSADSSADRNPSDVQTRLDGADDPELGRVPLQAPDDLDEAVDRRAGEDLAELVDQRRPLVGSAEGADRGERDREQREQRQQGVVRDHRGEVRAAVREEIPDDRVPVQYVRAPRHPIQAAPVSSRRHRRSRIRVREAREPALGRGDVGGLLWYRPRAATSGGPLNAHEALDDLKQISVQVTAAAIGGQRGPLEAGRRCRTAPRASVSCAWAPSCGRRPSRPAATSVATSCRRSRSRRLKAACSCCATRRARSWRRRRWIRSSGLVFYDLRTCLRTVAEGSREAAASASEPSGNGPREGFDGAA